MAGSVSRNMVRIRAQMERSYRTCQLQAATNLRVQHCALRIYDALLSVCTCRRARELRASANFKPNQERRLPDTFFNMNPEQATGKYCPNGQEQMLRLCTKN